MQVSNSGTLIVALIAIGVVSTAFVLIKTKHSIHKPFDPNNLSENDKIRYELAASIIDQAIKAKDWDYLENQHNTRTRDFPDLIAKINEALKNKPQDQK